MEAYVARRNSSRVLLLGWNSVLFTRHRTTIHNNNNNNNNNNRQHMKMLVCPTTLRTVATAGMMLFLNQSSSSSSSLSLYRCSYNDDNLYVNRKGRSSFAQSCAVESSFGGWTAAAFQLPTTIHKNHGTRLQQRRRNDEREIVRNFHGGLSLSTTSSSTGTSQSSGKRCLSQSNQQQQQLDDLSPTYKHLPRIYVDHRNGKNGIKEPNSLITLSSKQAHYLQTVMRISNPKRWGALINHVRIFNGYDGEWLAKLLLVDSDDYDDEMIWDDISRLSTTQPKRQRRQQQPKKRRRSKRYSHLADSDDDDAIVAQCVQCLQPQPQQQSGIPNYHVTLWMPPPKKKDRRKWLLEKVTELGVSALCFIQTDHSGHEEYNSVSGGSNRKTKLSNNLLLEDDSNENSRKKDMAHMIEAAEQCERFTIPKLLPSPMKNVSEETSLSGPTTLSEVIEMKWKRYETNDNNVITCWLICRERSPESCTIYQALNQLAGRGGYRQSEDNNSKKDKVNQPQQVIDRFDINILVGPEGGWSDREVQEMEDAIQQQEQKQSEQPQDFILQSVSLGYLVLRAETAAITAVGVAMLHEDYHSNPNS